MNSDTQPIERRRNSRFRANDRIVVEVRSSPIKVGRMLDISAGGLSFYYIDSGKAAQEPSELNIWVDNSLFLKEVNFGTVSDFRIDDSVDKGSVIVKRRGVLFESLTAEQKIKLDHIIEQYTRRGK